MAKLTVNKSDMSKFQPSPDGWYKGKLISFNEEVNKNKDGVNYVPTFSYKGKDEVERQVRHWFSNKAIGLEFVKFYYACQDKHFNINDLPDISELDTSLVKVGTEMWIHLSQNVWEGKLRNRVDNFAGLENPPF